MNTYCQSVKQYGPKSGLTYSVDPDLGPNCLHRLIADDTRQRVKGLIITYTFQNSETTATCPTAAKSGLPTNGTGWTAAASGEPASWQSAIPTSREPNEPARSESG